MAPTRWFIRRPHAIDRLRERAGFPVGTDSIFMETELRKALDAAAADKEQFFLQAYKPDQFAVKIALPGRNVVYAILQPATSQYHDYVVPTVLDTQMYASWRLPDSPDMTETAPVVKRERTTRTKPLVYLCWETPDGKAGSGEYCLDDVSEHMTTLLKSGVRRDTIKLYKEVPFEVSVVIPEAS